MTVKDLKEQLRRYPTDARVSRRAKTPARPTGGYPLTLGQVAEILRIRPRAVVDYVRRGELVGQRIGRSWQFSRAAIDSFFEEPPAWHPADFVSYGK